MLFLQHSSIVRGQTHVERFFSVAGTGAFQIVDSGRPGLLDLFPDRLVKMFGTDEELRELITYHLDHDGDRRAIAGELQRMVLAEHTYDRCVDRLAALLRL